MTEELNLEELRESVEDFTTFSGKDIVLALIARLEAAEAQAEEAEETVEALHHRTKRQRTRAEAAEKDARRMEKRWVEARRKVARVEALHQPMPVYNDECPFTDCDRPEEEHVETADGEWYHVTPLAYEACQSCRDEDGGYVEHPCETRAALEGPDHD